MNSLFNKLYRPTSSYILNQTLLKSRKTTTNFVYKSFCTISQNKEKNDIINNNDSNIENNNNNNSTLVNEKDNIFDKLSTTITNNNGNDNIISSSSETTSTATTTTDEPIKKRNLIGISAVELYEIINGLNFKQFTARQIWIWLYKKLETNILEFSDIRKAARELLNERFYVDMGQVKSHKVSKDGTRKYLIEFDEKAQVEAVFIPETEYGTLCVSSQVGCTFSCSFCHTGTQKMIRNLTASEIVSQVMLARKDLGDNDEMKLIRNIVFMGQGEPLYNYRNLVKAIDILHDPRGLNFGHQRVTISTSGVVPLIYRLSKDLPKTALAISLHAPNNKLRSELVTANKQWPVEELMAACKHWYQETRNRITFEYTMLDGVNDLPEHAEELITILKGISAHVNLIPFNPWPGAKYKSSDRKTIERFVRILEDARIRVSIRQPRGQDIDAACGQLRTNELNKKSLQ